MLILTKIDVQYLPNTVISIKKGFSGQNNFLTDYHDPIKNSPAKFPIHPLGGCPLSLNTIWKTLNSTSLFTRYIHMLFWAFQDLYIVNFKDNSLYKDFVAHI